MKKSNKLFLVLFLILILALNLEANRVRGVYSTKNLKGQEYYLKACSSCHGAGNRGGNMASINEWKELFKNNASELIDIHSDDEESKELIKYLQGESFKKQSKLMLEFLQEFAYDSEHIPTCN